MEAVNVPSVIDYTPKEEDADQGHTSLDLTELVELCALDDELFYQSFFPKTFRQPSVAKHFEMDDAINNPNYRLVHLKAFRGSAKTTRLRANTAKQIAYGSSRTILYVGASEPHAARSIQWLRTQLKFNTFFTNTYGLRIGRKDNETEVEVINEILGITTWVLGAGITGNVRGINFDDYRPDRIVLDDPLTDENAATVEQRSKIGNLIHGALRNSLAPISEAPNSKLIMAQTPIAKDDASDEAEGDPEWLTVTFSCWTDETAELPREQQVSSWPARFSTEELRKQKAFAAGRNKLSVFIREMEVRLTDPEKSAFKSFWIKLRTQRPPMMPCVIAIDPVPPPSQRQINTGFVDKDFEAIVVIGRMAQDYHILDYALNRGHEPNWTVAKIFEFYLHYRALRLVFKPVGYERTLKYILELEMKRRGVYIPVKTTTNTGMQKYHLIVNTITPLASYGHLYCGPEHVEFIEQMEQYPAVSNDDLLDATAVGLEDFVNPYLEVSEDGHAIWDDNVEDLVLEGRAP